MQYLNSVQLRGVVGAVRISDVQGRKLLQFSLVTNSVSKSLEGDVTITTQWHSVSHWAGSGDPVLTLARGDKAYVEGRLVCQRYAREDGTSCQSVSVRAKTVCRVEADTLEPEESIY